MDRDDRDGEIVREDAENRDEREDQSIVWRASAVLLHTLSYKTGGKEEKIGFHP